MSRKLGAIALGMAILVGAMSLKSAVTTKSSEGAVLTANGPAPVPTYPTKKRSVVQPTTVPVVR
jgi:hypothetical protein